MALSDLAVFSEYTYDSMNETLDQQIELFNAATRGGVVLRSGNMQGDYSDRAFWGRIDGLIRRRDAYGVAAVAEKELAQLIDTMVKVAAGTPPVRIDPGQFNWIQQNPELGGVMYGRQLAEGTLQDMLNTSLMALVAALSGEAEVIANGSAATATQVLFNTAQSKFGDRYETLAVWIMHSKPLFDIYGAAMANTAGLFTFGNVNVRQDAFGRSFVISDSPALFEDGGAAVTAGSFVVGVSYTIATVGTTDFQAIGASADTVGITFVATGVGAGSGTAVPVDLYKTLGLVPGAVLVERNGDFEQNTETSNGFENIIRSIQSEWSYNLGIKGFAWDKTAGGKSPNDAALAIATNWDRIATSHKDLAGVLIETR